MTVQQVLNSLIIEGFQVRADGQKIELKGPCDRLTPELRQAVRDNKAGLLGLLSPPRPEAFPPEHLEALRDAEVHVEPYDEAERWAIQNEHLFEPPADDWDSLPGLPPLPEVANVKDCPEGWQDNPQYRYIGRASKRLGLPQSMYHNPFPVGKPETPEKRLACIEKYKQRFMASTMLKAMARCELPGKTLVCWCSPLPCHGLVIREFIAQACWDPKYVAWWQEQASSDRISESPSGSHPPGDSDHNRL